MLPDLLRNIDPFDGPGVHGFDDMFPVLTELFEEQTKTPNLIDVLIEDFQSPGQQHLWDQFINNPFCRAMAFSKNPVEPSFREYATQGWVFSWEFLRYLMRQAAIAPNIPTVARQALQVAQQNLAVRTRRVLISDYLDVPGPTLSQVEPHATIRQYMEFLGEEASREDQLEKGDTFFDLHVLAIPSIVGHHLIAKKLTRLSLITRRPLNKAFKKIYVDTHISDICVQQLYSYFERNAAKYRDAHPVRLETWTRVFRMATELEIDMFMTFPFPPFLFDLLCDFPDGQECTRFPCPRHTRLVDIPTGPPIATSALNSLR